MKGPIERATDEESFSAANSNGRKFLYKSKGLDGKCNRENLPNEILQSDSFTRYRLSLVSLPTHCRFKL